MIVHFSSHFVPYVGKQRQCQVEAESMAKLLETLDAKYPGLRFRIIDEGGRVRKHVRIFVNAQMILGLDQMLKAQDEIHILGALSGG